LRGLWVVPTGGILSGLIVGLLLSPFDPGVIAPATAVLAITSKHLFRARLANVFNPAALALVLAAVLFDAGHSWWGALPDLGLAGAAIIAAAGLYTAERIHKLPMVFVFLGAFYSLATAATFWGSGADYASLFRAPDAHAALFFAFFMLDDPPTSPTKYRDQVVFGALTAACGFAFFQVFGWLYYLLAALLVSNGAWAAVRTWRARGRRRHSGGPARLVRA
jgi:Na+-translocating ferredoxin:NAD+ oxidoreductase RnfD subunit